MKITKLLAALVASATLAGASSLVTAAPTLRLVSGLNSVTVADGLAGDINPLAGVVTWVGAIGAWISNVTTGHGSPFLQPSNLDLNSVNASTLSNGADTLHVYLTDTNFTLGAGPNLGDFLGLIGGTTAGTVKWELWIDDGNNPFALTTLIGADTSVGAAFSDIFSNTALVNDTFSMTLHVAILHGNSPVEPNGRLVPLVTSFDFEARLVPEPNTLALIGVALFGVALIGRRRRS